MSKEPVITCVGEVLWDALPGGIFLGGAPLNVCLNLNRLGAKARIVSRVGKDRLGREAMNRMAKDGLNTNYIQRDEQHETGFVKVELDSEGDPHYDIIRPAAWDFIDLKQKRVSDLLEASWAVVFGTLAHRQNPALRELLDLGCHKVLDMNLRAPHYEKEWVLKLVEGSDILKMNVEELNLLKSWLSLSGDMEKTVRQLSVVFPCQTVCITRGGAGSALLHEERWFEHKGYPVTVRDAVGAGDAFLAALLYGIREERKPEELLPLANAAGAFVASHSGANPEYSISVLESVMSGERSLQ